LRAERLSWPLSEERLSSQELEELLLEEELSEESDAMPELADTSMLSATAAR
jgi:hypothetical protein